jgi:adenine-specific DNA-methyltransferase
MDGAKLKDFEETLKNPFQIDRFVQFNREFFNNISTVNPGKIINDYWNWTEFSYNIGGYYHIANYTDNGGKKIAIFAVMLKNGKNLDRARSLQRNFVRKLMIAANIDSTITAFYADDEPKWRLSFVKLDYELSNGKAEEKITPAKRYSYLVGKGEPCHTAEERLFPIYSNEKTNPTVSEIEEAFSVEKVTDEFFEYYKEKYHQLREHLESNQDFADESLRLGFTSEQFVKKLMGQIAFLYFIQKKGWLGVNVFPKSKTAFSKKQYNECFYKMGKASRETVPKVFQQTGEDEYICFPDKIKKLTREEQEILALSFTGQPWGTGPRDFIRKLFDECENKNGNFYDDYLEPLFYEALNVKRGANDYYYRFSCRIPFLNGGLFEPLDNYDWENNNFKIGNDKFSNGKDGILDVFELYNFTMNEDEPLEKEVAIDPEMLGKIFEKLLDAKERKKSGSFYTPREIVHYMCQESLVNYLVTKTGVSYEAIKEFITYGEFMKDEDTTEQAMKGSGKLLVPDEIYDRSRGIDRFKEIDQALADIKVADPAAGSGAFPLGMVSEIVRARRKYYRVSRDEYKAGYAG